jgi:uncharacterized alpha-E superfamily protein
MLSRTAASLYWMGRYVERADFTARLIEATVRLDALSSRPAGTAAWKSALTVIEALEEYEAVGQPIMQRHVAPFLTLSADHPGSVLSCIEAARRNARAVRTALSREAWTAINHAWLCFENQNDTHDIQALLSLVAEVQGITLAFTGALERMLHHPSSMFIHLGAAIERADNSARLLDVKYHILLPEDEVVGGAIDRDQWTTILQTVSAVNAYRLLYSDGLNASDVVEFLTLRPELPRSLLACATEVVHQLNSIAHVTGHFATADSLAMTRLANLKRTKVSQIIGEGLHEYLEDFLTQNASLDEAIGFQFRFN